MKPHPALGRYLDQLAARYGPEHLHSDPIASVRTFRDPNDLEIAAFLAAGLAFGRVSTILTHLGELWSRLDHAPAARARAWTPRTARRLAGFRHRWVGGEDVARVLPALGALQSRHGSLRAAFLTHYDPEHADLVPALSGLVGEIRRELAPRRRALPLGVRTFLADPARGGACKRLHLFARWMVRADDGVDLGLWVPVRADQLLVPLDTHVARLSRYLGLTARRTVDGKMAVQVTQALRRYAPEDPVRYDFALSRLGILDLCPRRVDPCRCRGCSLLPVCMLGRSVESSDLVPAA